LNFEKALNKILKIPIKVRKKLISIIIPGYNEAEIITNTIDTVMKVFASIGKPFEIFIVDDGSTDNTLQILKKLAKSKKYPNLRFISYKDGPSRRENLAKSFKLLKGDYVLVLDMDLAMDLKHLREMVYWLEQGYDMVLPSRYLFESHIKRKPYRLVISKMYNAFIRLAFGTGIQDNICGFKGFKKNAILKLAKEAGTDKTRRRGVFFETEIIVYARLKNVKIKEIPINWIEGKSSAMTFSREIKMLPYIFKFWIKYLKMKMKK